MSQTYSTGDLYDLADRPSDDVRVSVAGDRVGVALPDWSSIQPCAILSPESARKLGAQLLLAADELDAIQSAAFGFHDDPQPATDGAHEKLTSRVVLKRADILGRALYAFADDMPEGPECDLMRRQIAELVELAGGAQL